MQPNQQVTFLCDGADDLAGWTDLQNATAEYVLDWFHITMRFTVLASTMTGLHDQHDDTDDADADGAPVEVDEPGSRVDIAGELRREVGRAKWHVWHGNLHRALELLADVAGGIDACADNDARTKASRMLYELAGYLDRNHRIIPSYAERHLAGEPISSATAEATVNLVIAKRMVKKQQMRWSPTGAHHMLQVRTRVLDHQLDHDINRWHPRTAQTPTETATAA